MIDITTISYYLSGTLCNYYLTGNTSEDDKIFSDEELYEINHQETKNDVVVEVEVEVKVEVEAEKEADANVEEEVEKEVEKEAETNVDERSLVVGFVSIKDVSHASFYYSYNMYYHTILPKSYVYYILYPTLLYE